MSFSRRRFIARSSLTAGSLVAAPALMQGKELSDVGAAMPRRILHLVSDGMSMGTLTCADHLAHLIRGRGTVWMDLYNRPEVVTGFMDMRSLNSLVTDSSAASSSWGSGSRIANGAVNQLPDGRNLTPLYTVLGEAGWKRGLVTTTEITHATPAGFATNARSRNDAEDIAVQYFERGIEVLLGGGRKYLSPDSRKDRRDLLKEFEDAGWAVPRTARELVSAPLDRRWMGTFAEGHLPYVVDLAEDADLRRQIPSLAVMTRAALDRLGHEERFILQVEGGRVDHACHNCDAASAFREQIAFDEAIEVCLEFQRRQPGTLIVMTTDHGNGNPGLDGIGGGYGDSSALFRNVTRVRASFGVILDRLKGADSAEDVKRVIGEATGYVVPDRKAGMFLETVERKREVLFDVMGSATGQMGQLLANHIGVGWTGGVHTSDYVPVLAVGPGAERFRGFIQCTDVFRHYVELAGIGFRNPSVPLTAALEERMPSGGEENLHSYLEVGSMKAGQAA